MKKVIFENEFIKTVNFDDIKNSDIVGFVDSVGRKGFVSYMFKSYGKPFFKAICMYDFDGESVPNYCYGNEIGYSSVKDALKLKDCDITIKDAYVFPDMGLLLKWLAEA